MSSVVTETGVALQATQAEAAEAIRDSFLLSSSLWVNIAPAGASALLFGYTGRNVTDSRAKFIFAATLLRWVAANEGIVSSPSVTAGTGSSATADD